MIYDPGPGPRLQGGPYKCEFLFIKGDAHANAYTPRQTHPKAWGSIFQTRSERAWGPDSPSI